MTKRLVNRFLNSLLGKNLYDLSYLHILEWFEKKTGKFTSHDLQNEMLKVWHSLFCVTLQRTSEAQSSTLLWQMSVLIPPTKSR